MECLVGCMAGIGVGRCSDLGGRHFFFLLLVDTNEEQCLK